MYFLWGLREYKLLELFICVCGMRRHGEGGIWGLIDVSITGETSNSVEIHQQVNLEVAVLA